MVFAGKISPVTLNGIAVPEQIVYVLFDILGLGFTVTLKSALVLALHAAVAVGLVGLEVTIRL